MSRIRVSAAETSRKGWAAKAAGIKKRIKNSCLGSKWILRIVIEV
jgi:hypothetical protein